MEQTVPISTNMDKTYLCNDKIKTKSVHTFLYKWTKRTDFD